MKRQKYKNIQRRYFKNDNVTKPWHLGLSVVSCRLSEPITLTLGLKNAYFWVDGEIN